MEYTENPLAFGERGNNNGFASLNADKMFQHVLQCNQCSEHMLPLLAKRSNVFRP